MSYYLVTGGAGFIGSNIVGKLLERGEHVRILDNFSTGKRENIAEYLGKIELIEGDIRSYHAVREAVEGIDIVLHQGALPSVPRSIQDPFLTDEVNVSGTINLLTSARDGKVKKFVFASSSSVYGNSEILPKTESLNPNPLSPYAVSKLAGEHYCQVFSKIFGIDTIILRYFNVFGPKQDPDSQYSAVIPKFIISIFKNIEPVIYGDGHQSRDFTYVDNVVNANILASEADCEPGMVINCACHQQITLNMLVECINSKLGKRIEPVYKESRLGDVRHSMADISRAKELLNYSPQITFKEGIEKTIDFYLDKNNR